MTTTVNTGDLLTLAAAIGDGVESVPGMSDTRAACLITRQALEQVIDALLTQRQLGCPSASMRARLICLGQAYAEEPGEIAYRAETAWRRLSSACHHHAYELNPSRGEAHALINEVDWLAKQLVMEQGTERM